jgi:cation:H+ antiporter
MALGVGPAALTLLVCALVSLGASAVLVVRLERLAARLGLSEAILGLIAALAADGPEIATSITALLRGQHNVSAGVVLGSNVFNLAALLGLAGIIAGRIQLHRSVIVFAGTVSLWVAAASVAVTTGLMGATTTLVLTLGVLVPYVIVSGISAARLGRLPLPRAQITWLHQAVVDEEAELLPAIHPTRGHLRDAAVAGVAVIVVVGASVGMEQTATSLGDRLEVPQIIVGAIILAAITSLPNAVAAVHLARRGRGTAVLSEALNSNNLNVVGGLLIPASILGLGQASGGGVFVAASYAGLTVLCLAVAYLGRGIGRVAGVLIIGAYLIFVGVLVVW